MPVKKKSASYIQGKQLSNEEFTAILVNEGAYKDILCLAAKKIECF